MQQYKSAMDVVRDYEPCPHDALATFRLHYSLRPNDEGMQSEEFASYAKFEVYYGDDVIRDEEGYVMVEETIRSLTGQLDDLFYYEHTSSFIRTMNRMKKLKEDLMMSVWHPTRVEKFLDKWGEDAFDNFVGG